MAAPARLSAEEIREVIHAVTGLLEETRRIHLALLDETMKRLRGEELGREAASLYRALVEAGLPEAAAAEITKEYLRRLLDLAAQPLARLEASTAPAQGLNIGRAAAILALMKTTWREEGGEDDAD